MPIARPETWILVADGGRARVLRLHGNKLEPALPEDFAGANVPSREINSDRPGRTFDSHGAGRHAIEPREDPKQAEETSFVRDVAATIETHAKAQAFERLIVVADPRSLGVLRAAFGPKTRERIKDEIAKDLTKLSPDDLLAALSDKIVI